MARKRIPAGTGEKMQYLVHEYNDNTIRFVLHYPCLLDSSALQQAACWLTGSLDVLHASFRTGKLDAYWTVHPDFRPDCCFRSITSDKPVETALALSLQPIRPERHTKLVCTLVQDETQSAVVFRVSHLVADGKDACYLLHKLIEAYHCFAEGDDADLPEVKNGSRKAEQVYRNLNVKQMLSLLKDPRTGIKSFFPFADEDPGRLQFVWSCVPSDVMAAAHDRAGACGATVNDLLIAACYRAYAMVPGVDAHSPMSIMSMLDLRRHCPGQDSAGIGNLTGSLPTLLENGVQGDFEETLREIAAQTAQRKHDPLAGLTGMPLLHCAARTAPMRVLLAVASRLYGSMSVGLTNLGTISCDALQLEGCSPDQGWFAGPVKKKPAVQISVASFDGSCSIGVAGKFTDEDAAVIQSMTDCMVQQLCDYANPIS